MCGICGIIYSDREKQVEEDLIVCMRDVMKHRGPDDAGKFLDQNVALGHRRLSIIDLSKRGHQPMSTPDGRFWIVYNGEVYNFKDLRCSLESDGVKFRSNTDTEVVLHLFAKMGKEMLKRLNGMFAFAIWDREDKTLFIARDRLGIKPLYYSITADGFYFASEEKSLFAAGVPAEFDSETWEEILCFRYIAGTDTPFVGIKRLLPGQYLIWKDGNIQIQRWWNLMERVKLLRESMPVNPIEWFRETFDNAVNLRRISDVPLGILLSGGLDSSSIAASLAHNGGSGIASFTVRFTEPAYDEGPIAQQVANRWNLNYHELRLSSDELMSRLYLSSWHSDEPLTHHNDAHILSISKYAKSRVTVLLCGEGGDETLGGYVRYQPLRYPKLLNAVRPVFQQFTKALNLNHRVLKLKRFLDLGDIKNFILYNACNILPQDLELLGMKPTMQFPFREQILNEAKLLYSNDPMRQAMYSDQHTFLCSILDRNDRMTMGASIECRVPFLDHRLVEILAAFPSSILLSGHRGKYLLRKSLGFRLPKVVRKYRKWGFEVPWGHYFRKNPELIDVIKSLPHVNPIQQAPFNQQKFKNIVNDFLKGDETHYILIRQLFMLRIWYQTIFEKVKLEIYHN